MCLFKCCGAAADGMFNFFFIFDRFATRWWLCSLFPMHWSIFFFLSNLFPATTAVVGSESSLYLRPWIFMRIHDTHREEKRRGEKRQKVWNGKRESPELYHKQRETQVHFQGERGHYPEVWSSRSGERTRRRRRQHTPTTLNFCLRSVRFLHS